MKSALFSPFTVFIMDTTFRDWAGLPAHIVDLIVTMLDGFFDYLRFCGVCSEWRKTAHEANLDYKIKSKIFVAPDKELPMLMFTTDENSDRRSVFNILNGKTYEIKLPIPYKYRFAGSSCGWLLCLEKTMVLNLVNPCNNTCIALPALIDLPTFKYEWHKKYFAYYIKKGILFSNSSVSPDGFGVLVIYSASMGKLAFFKSGEPSWNFINSEDRLVARDIIHYKGKLYAVNFDSKLVEIDTASKTFKTIITPSHSYSVPPDAIYLVQSQDGELLMVERFWFRMPEVSDEEDYTDDEDIDASSDSEIDSSDIQSIIDLGEFERSFEFKVFKMTHPLEEGSATWVEISNIGEQALFVGDNHSVSVSTVKFPECLSNSIYYTAEHHAGLFPYVYQGVNEDSFVFNLEDKTIDYHHKLEGSQKYIQPPIWFVPNPQEINLGK